MSASRDGVMAPAAGHSLAISDVVKTYVMGSTEVNALRGVSLNIGRNEYVAIMGPSGSGKSTAMNILGCLDTPTAGKYFFKGARVESLSRDQRARLRQSVPGFQKVACLICCLKTLTLPNRSLQQLLTRDLSGPLPGNATGNPVKSGF